MENLVFYYSWTGNTKAVASEISSITNGRLIEICEEKPRKSFVGSAFASIIGKKSLLKPVSIHMPKEPANIFLGTPVWASHCTPAVNAFLDKADLKDKNIFLFFTLASEKAPQELVESMTDKVIKKGGKVSGSISIQMKRGQSADTGSYKKCISDWINTIKL